MSTTETLIYFKISINSYPTFPKFTYAKAILLNGLSELSFPIYQMISSNRFSDIMSLKNVVKGYSAITLKLKKILIADLRFLMVALMVTKFTFLYNQS